MLFKNKFLTKFLTLGWTSCIGDALYVLALMTYAATLDDPALGILIITISSTFPQIVEVITGALADSTKRKTQLLINSGVFRGFIFISIGFIIMTTNSLWGILAIGILNAFSDTAGNFTELIKTPMMKMMVKEEQLEEVIGTDQGFRQIIDVIAGFLGTLLLGFLGIYYLTFMNAFVFFVVAFGFNRLKKHLVPLENKITPPEYKTIKDMLTHIFRNISRLLKMTALRNFLLLSASLGAVLGTTTTVLLMAFANNVSAQVASFEFTVTLLKTILLTVAIVASVVGPKLLGGVPMSILLITALIGGILFMGTLGMFEMIWISVIFLAVMMFCGTVFSVRLNALFMKSVPTETLGTMAAGMNVFSAVLPIPITILLNTVAAISLNTYAIVGSVVAFIVIIAVLILKVDKIDFKAQFSNIQSYAKE